MQLSQASSRGCATHRVRPFTSRIPARVCIRAQAGEGGPSTQPSPTPAGSAPATRPATAATPAGPRPGSVPRPTPPGGRPGPPPRPGPGGPGRPGVMLGPDGQPLEVSGCSPSCMCGLARGYGTRVGREQQDQRFNGWYWRDGRVAVITGAGIDTHGTRKQGTAGQECCCPRVRSRVARLQPASVTSILLSYTTTRRTWHPATPHARRHRLIARSHSTGSAGGVDGRGRLGGCGTCGPRRQQRV